MASTHRQWQAAACIAQGLLPACPPSGTAKHQFAALTTVVVTCRQEPWRRCCSASSPRPGSAVAFCGRPCFSIVLARAIVSCCRRFQPSTLVLPAAPFPYKSPSSRTLFSFLPRCRCELRRCGRRAGDHRRMPGRLQLPQLLAALLALLLLTSAAAAAPADSIITLARSDRVFFYGTARVVSSGRSRVSCWGGSSVPPRQHCRGSRKAQRLPMVLARSPGPCRTP